MNLSEKAKRVRTRHPNKSKATAFGLALGVLTGCAGFPVGGTIRLVCGTATGILDVIDKTQRADSGATVLDAASDH